MLSERELELIATIKRGKDYNAAGRLDLAEYQYRKVLLMGANDSSVFNDLGFILQSQSRLDEAEEMYRKALEREPRNIIAHDNLARLLVLREDIAGAKAEYGKVIDLYNTFTKRALLETIGQDFTSADLVAVYRNLSMLDYLDGDFDEAICESRRAFELSPDAVQTGRHARLLLSLGHVVEAEELLKNQVASWQWTAQSKVVLDLLIALYTTGDYPAAQEVNDSLINRSDLEPIDRQTARLIKLLLNARRVAGRAAQKDSKSADSSDVLSDAAERESFEALAEEFPNLCKTYTVDPDQYWPDTLREEVDTQMKTLCQDDELVYPGSAS